MRRLTRLSLHLALGLTSVGFIAAPVFAQDLGTYRPGQAYQSVTSPGADVCNSHCAGDAQCRAWNYVKVNPKATGVCEFLATASSPVHSPISISGENVSQTRFSRPLTQGGTNTIRVGTSIKAAPAKTAVTKPAPNRRVEREAVPQRINPQATADRRVQQRRQSAGGGISLTEQQNQYRRETGDLAQQNFRKNNRQDPRLAAIQPQRFQQARPRIGQPQPQFTQPQPPRQFQPFLDGAGQPAAQTPPAYQGQQQLGPQQRFQPRAQPRSQQRTLGGQNRGQRRRQVGGRPPIGQPIGPVAQPRVPQSAQTQAPTLEQPNQRAQAPQLRSSHNLPRSSAGNPVTHDNAQAAFARRQADLAAIASGNSVDPIQQSLYGTLNDDVKVPTALTHLPADPNAPIATSASRPVGPVQTQALGQLAGGPR